MKKSNYKIIGGFTKMKKSKKILSCFLVSLMLMSTMMVVLTGNEASAAELVSSKAVYQNSFGSGSNLNDFVLSNRCDHTPSVRWTVGTIPADTSGEVYLYNSDCNPTNFSIWHANFITTKEGYEDFVFEVKASFNWALTYFQFRKDSNDNSINHIEPGAGVSFMIHPDNFALTLTDNGAVTTHHQDAAITTKVKNALEKRKTNGSIKDVFHDFKVTFINQDMTIEINGDKVLEYKSSSYVNSKGYVGLMGWKGNNYRFKDLVITPIVPEVESIESPMPLTVTYGTDVSGLSLPETATVIDTKGNSLNLPVSWDKSLYNGDVAGDYNLVGTITITDNDYINQPTTEIKATIKINVREQEAVPSNVISVKSVDKVEVDYGTNKSDILLPGKVTVIDDDDQETEVSVLWVSDSYNPKQPGEYIFTGTLTMPGNLLLNPNNIKAEVKVLVKPDYDKNTTVKFYFDDKSEIPKFDTYYLDEVGDEIRGGKRDFDDVWEIKDGKLRRLIGTAGNAGGTNKVASLVYNEMKFYNFELSVDIIMGDDSWFWPVITFRQTEPGTYFIHNGCGVFFQQNGVPTFWGRGSGGPLEGPAATGFNRNNEYKLTLRVVGNRAEVFLNGESVYDIELPEESMSEGYVGLSSVNNMSHFDNLRITKLNNDGNPTNLFDDTNDDNSQPNDNSQPSDTFSPFLLIALMFSTLTIIKLNLKKLKYKDEYQTSIFRIE